jgi:hypothetical protein
MIIETFVIRMRANYLSNAETYLKVTRPLLNGRDLRRRTNVRFCEFKEAKNLVRNLSQYVRD